MKSLFTCDTFLFCRSRYGGVRRETLLHGVSAFRSLFCFSISKKYNRRVCVNYGFFLLDAAFWVAWVRLPLLSRSSPKRDFCRKTRGYFSEQRLVIEPSFRMGLGQCRVELLVGIVLWDWIWTQFLAQLCINFPLHDDFLSFARTPPPAPSPTHTISNGPYLIGLW